MELVGHCLQHPFALPSEALQLFALLAKASGLAGSVAVLLAKEGPLFAKYVTWPSWKLDLLFLVVLGNGPFGLLLVLLL
jgi:hypothetical protein